MAEKQTFGIPKVKDCQQRKTFNVLKANAF